MTEARVATGTAAQGVSDGPLVSVIVTSYALDRLRDIEQMLDSLKAQTYLNLEVIFVGERTKELCAHVAAYAERLGMTNLKALFNSGRSGLSAARNVGIEHAQGEIIAFLDDDAVAFPDWAEEMVASFVNGDGPIAVTGPALPAWEDESMSWLPEEFFWIISCRQAGGPNHNGVRNVRNVWGVNMGFRREAFDGRSFDEELGGNMGANDGSKLGLLGEDTLFSVKVRQETGRPLIYNPRLRVFHKVYAYRFKPRFVRRRAFWEGYTKAWLKRLHGQENGHSGKILATEYGLLRQIALHFFPRVIAGFAWEPALSWRRLRLAVGALAHVALGYMAAVTGPIGRLLCRRYGR